MVSRLLKRLQTRGALAENIAIVGSGSLAIEFARAIQSAPAGRVRMLGFFDDAAAAAANSGAAAGTIDQLLELALKQNIDWIVLALPQAQEVLVAPMIERLRGAATRIGLCPKHPDFYRMPRARLRVGESFTLDLLLDQPIVRWNAVFKRAEDLVIGGLLTLLLSPLLAVVAIAVKLDSPGPVIFRQRRHTLSNREFDIYKFRTMHSGPNAVATPLVQTTRNDARITRVGAVLRSFSIDELPQLFNVLQGTMSLVGPRPHATDMRTDERLGVEITEEYLHRHRVKPGITGWAQVNGARGATDTEDQLLRRVELDLYYIDKWSLRLDLQIILRTVSVVISRNNAF